MRNVLNAIIVSILIVCPALDASTEEVPIGFIGPLSGDVAGFGVEAKNSVELAVNEINSSNYIPGVRLKAVYEDGKCAGRDATAAAQKLIAMDNVKAIFGGVCSTETLAAATVTEKAKVILFTSFSSNPNVSRAGDYVFRNCINDLEGGREAARLVRQGGYKRPAVIAENTDYCLGLRNAFVSTMKTEGIEVVADEVFNPSDNDFRSILLRVNSKHPDIVFVDPQGGLKGGLIVRQIREMKLPIAIIGNDVFSSADAREGAGGLEKLEGMTFVDAPEISARRGEEAIERYKKLYGDKMQSDFLIAFTIDAVYLIADAIRAVGPDTAKMRDYLYNLPESKGLGFNYRFDSNGDMVGVPYAVKRIQDGKIEQIRP